MSEECLLCPIATQDSIAGRTCLDGGGEGGENLLRLQSGGAGLDAPTLNPPFLFSRDRFIILGFMMDVDP